MYDQPAELNVEVVINEDLRASNEERIEEQAKKRKQETGQRKKAASQKRWR